MHDDDPIEEHRELAAYDADDRPVRSERTRRMMRVVVIVGLVALVLPGILVTVSTQVATADAACRFVVAAHDPEAVAAVVRFEPMGAAGPAWYCYSQRFNGSEILLRSLGLIPGLSPQPDGELV